MRPVNDSPYSRKQKELSRKIVINYSDSDTENDDIYCPTWLKHDDSTTMAHNYFSETSYGYSVSVTEIPQRGLSMSKSFSKKRNIDLTLERPISEKHRSATSKRVNSPMHIKFFKGSANDELRSLLVEFTETEITYYRILCSIYQHCFEIFSKGECESRDMDSSRGYLLKDLTVLKELSYKFIKNVIQSVITSTGFKDQERISRFREGESTSNDKSDVLTYNVSALVANCDLDKLNFGSLLNAHFGCNKLKAVMASFSYKQCLLLTSLEDEYRKRCSRIKNFEVGYPEINSLTDGRHRLDTLLIFPLKRLAKYPVLIKQLIDISQENQHELNTSLIKVNQLLTKCTQRKASSWSELDNFDRTMQHEYEEDNTYNVRDDFDPPPLDSAHDLKLKYAGNEDDKRRQPRVKHNSRTQGDYLPIVANFKRKFDRLREVHQCLSTQLEVLHKFMASQLKYAVMWDGVLGESDEEIDDHYIRSIYSSFVSKMRTQTGTTADTVRDFNAKVVVPLGHALQLCEEIVDQLHIHSKYKSAQTELLRQENGPTKLLSKRKHEKAQICTIIEHQIHERLPSFTRFISQIVDLVFCEYNSLYCSWLRQLIGERSMKEYSQLLPLRIHVQPSSTGVPSSSSAPSHHHDIVMDYRSALDMTWQALNPVHLSANRNYSAFFSCEHAPEDI